MPRDHRLYIDDILVAAGRIRSYVASMDFSAFQNDDKTFDAVIRNLEVIGEAVRSLPDEIKSDYPDAEWKKVIAFRNVLAHEYFGISPEIVWDVITTKLGPLERICRELSES